MTIVILMVLFYFAMGVGTLIKCSEENVKIVTSLRIIIAAPICAIYAVIVIRMKSSPVIKQGIHKCIKNLDSIKKSRWIHLRFRVRAFFDLLNLFLSFTPVVLGLIARCLICNQVKIKCNIEKSQKEINFLIQKEFA